MRRRSKARGETVKTRRHKTSAPKAARRRRLPAASQETDIARLARELEGAREQLTAASELLKVINSSPGELEPVFNTMLANATRICEAKIGVLYLRDGDSFRLVATTQDAPPAYVEARKQIRWEKNFPPDGPIRRAATTKQVEQVTEISKLQSYLERHPVTVGSVELGKFRTVIGVPMLKDDELIGVIHHESSRGPPVHRQSD
jgi:GAF domain-containing protein